MPVKPWHTAASRRPGLSGTSACRKCFLDEKMHCPCAILIPEFKSKKLLNFVPLFLIIARVDSWIFGRVSATARIYLSPGVHGETSACPQPKPVNMQSLRMAGAQSTAYKIFHFLRHGQAQHNPRAEVTFDSQIQRTQDHLNMVESAGCSYEWVLVSTISRPNARG